VRRAARGSRWIASSARLRGRGSATQKVPAVEPDAGESACAAFGDDEERAVGAEGDAVGEAQAAAQDVDPAVGCRFDTQRTATRVGGDMLPGCADPQDPAVVDPGDEVAAGQDDDVFGPASVDRDGGQPAGTRGQRPSAFCSSFLVMLDRPLMLRFLASL
jgi:hypothetical protein